jgi:hypothetical protein
MDTALPDSRRLKLLQKYDPLKHWWSVTEMRFCKKCEHLFTGRDIRILEEENQEPTFYCPTFDCEGKFEDWEYPDLHL